MLAYAVPASFIGLMVTFAAWIAGFVVAIRLARTGVKKLIWRLRNRLIVAYAFIAMVPIALILALVLVSAYGLTGQIAIYLINSELDRRTTILKGSAAAILEAPAEHRPEVILRTQDFTQRFFPATEILVRDGGEYRYPPSSTISAPPAAWKDANGIIVKDAQLYSWANLHSGGTEVADHGPAQPGVSLEPAAGHRPGQFPRLLRVRRRPAQPRRPAQRPPRASRPRTTSSICR